MVTYSDVTKRFAAYFGTVACIVIFSEFTRFLTLILTLILAAVNWHMKSPRMFAVFVSLMGPMAASLCVTLSHHTWWYAHGVPLLGVPLWLFPAHGVFAHWVLDSYWLVTLGEVRKATLP